MFGMGVGELFLVSAIWFAIPAAAFYLLLRAVRAFERRAPARNEIAAIDERIARLEDDLSAITDQLDVLAEGQRFTTRVLADRTTDTAAPNVP